MGDKRYELSNHLGNVLSVVSDRKLFQNPLGFTTFAPDVFSYSDYYPFGMLVPNRHKAGDDYRYGFQGQEKDDELKGEGNSLNYTFRMHDPRVGRFFAPDPLEFNFPNYSPYMFAGNRVILFTELEGLEEKIPNIQNTIYAKSFYNPKLSMDMSKVGNNATTINGNITVASTYTAKDGVRNYVAYWNAQLENHPEMFDAANTARVKNGAAPTVNDVWIKYNPAHGEFKGDKLIHHHIYQGKVATAIPETLHNKFSKFLHPFKRVSSSITSKIGIKSTLSKVGTVLSLTTLILDFVSENPNNSWNQGFGNGMNVGQLYNQLDGDMSPITGAYYMINSKKNNYDSKGNLESVESNISTFYLKYNTAKKELELKSGTTSTYIQNKGETEATEVKYN